MIKRLIEIFDLHTGEENKGKVLENVKSNITFQGATLWILACAIVVASIGLNVNSTAVIIGAMLISPLMGPIVGAGFGLGIFDFDLLKVALKNLLIATVVSLVVSTAYFLLSPFKEVQSELVARTSPNIYDVLIAFFGGLVGVIAITRVEKGNPIPGVAIATALMPPLCTAGYGIAIGNLKYFLGAFLLYTINCVFICISTFLIVKLLKYPAIKQVNEKQQKQVKYIITTLILILILPSTYFAYKLSEEKKYNHKVEAFIENEFLAKGYTVLYKNVKFNAKPKKIELAFLSKKFNDVELKALKNKLTSYDISGTQLNVRQDTTDLKKYILNEINSGRSQLNSKDIAIASLENEIKADTYDNSKILSEVKILFPEITSLSISNHKFHENTDSIEVVPVLIYKSDQQLPNSSNEKLALWLKKRLSKDQIQIFRIE